jgi:arylsulfatase A-like enzyme
MEKGLEYVNRETFPPLPPNFEADPDEPEALKLRRQNMRYGHELAETKDWDEVRWREYLHTYAHIVTQVDRAVGQVLHALEEGGWKDDTLVIFTSDHGEGCAAHRWATKLSLYEESAAVPLVISYSGHIKPGVSCALASGLDLMPTICDYAGAKPPELPGISLRPALAGTEETDGRFVVCELAADKDRPEIQGRMVRTRRYQYCAFAPGGDEQLFDLQEDPGETKNLVPEKDHAGELKRHRELLADWSRKTEDPFPVGSECKLLEGGTSAPGSQHPE